MTERILEPERAAMTEITIDPAEKLEAARLDRLDAPLNAASDDTR